MFKLDQILLAQNSQEIMQDLSNSEARLEDLNRDLDVVRVQYLNLVQDYNSASFFNVDNIYFWFLVVGLLLLLFGLLYLLAELQQGQAEDKKVKKVLPKNKFEDSVIKISSPAESNRVSKKIKNSKKYKQTLNNLANISQEVDKLTKSDLVKEKSKSKALKIKVVKVK